MFLLYFVALDNVIFLSDGLALRSYCNRLTYQLYWTLFTKTKTKRYSVLYKYLLT